MGGSIDSSGNPRAFFWQNGVMTDLNSLTTESPLYLLFGCAISSDGVITGLGVTSAGELHTYVATPESRADSASDLDGVATPNSASEYASTVAQRRLRLGRSFSRLAALKN